jgi:type I restriction enzyme S subunit
MLVPFPPIAEQQRIGSKVDELMALCDQLAKTRAEQEERRDQLLAAFLHRLNNGAEGPELRENARVFLNCLPNVTARPDQLNKIRQIIVSLGLRGHLVPQDPKDASATELLLRIQAANGVLGARRQLGKMASLPLEPIFQPPFAIPNSWQWTTLGTVARGLRYGTSVKCSYELLGAPVLRIPNVKDGRLDIEDLKYGPLSDRESRELQLQLGDILMVRSNGSLDLVGRAALVEEDAIGLCYAGYLVRVRTDPTNLNTRYLVLALNSELVRKQIEGPIRTTVGLKNVNAKELGALIVPIPPLAEQQRIVNRVEELVALCDGIEQQLGRAVVQSQNLAAASIHQALASTPLVVQ